jgi:hypothetical protein
VPGADNFATFDHSLPQRPAAMQADVVHGAVGTVHVGDADRLLAAGKFFGFVGGREFGLSSKFGEVRHGKLAISLWQLALSFDFNADGNPRVDPAKC